MRRARRNRALAAAYVAAARLLVSFTVTAITWAFSASRQADTLRVARNQAKETQAKGDRDRGLTEAERVDCALAWADRHVKGRATVRLLVAPAYYSHALLVVRGDAHSAVLVAQPRYNQLAYEREYPLAEFLKLLAKEHPPEP